MKITDRQAGLIWGIVALTLIAAQCGLPGLFAEPTATPQPVELTYVSFIDGSDSNQAEQKLIEQFEATQANITVARGQYTRSPASYLADSPPPDLMVVIADYDTLSAIEAGLALDITDVWRDADLAATYPAGFQTFGQREGRQYFLPVADTWTGIYYDPQLFEQYNVAPPESWAEFLTLSETLWLNGVTPLAVDRNDEWSVIMWFDYLSLRLYGPDFYRDLQQGRIPYNDAQVREVFEMWRDLVERGYFGESLSTGSLARNFNQLIDGKVAMILTSPVLIQDLPQPWLDQLAFFPFPIIDPALPASESVPSFGYLIPAGTEHPAEATAFLAYMSSAEVQSALTQQLGPNFGVIPMATFNPAMQQGISLIRATEAIVPPYIFASPPAMTSRAANIFRQFLRDPDSLDDGLEALETARQKVFEQ